MLQRYLYACNLAQEHVDFARRHDAWRAVFASILKHPPARQFAQHRARDRNTRAAKFFLDILAALGTELQRHRVALDLNVRLQHRGRAARAVLFGIALAARADRAAGDELDHRGERELACRLRDAEMLAHHAADARHRLDQALQALCLAPLAHLLPVGVITILQPPGGIAPDRLDVRTGIGGVPHRLIGRRHREALEPRARQL